MGNTSQNSLTGSNDREWFRKEKKIRGNESFLPKTFIFQMVLYVL